MSNTRIALVTGGSRGIGRATAIRLAKQGHDIAFCFLSNRAGAEETVEAVKEEGARAISIRANIGNEGHIEKLFGRVEEEFGALDVLVANAATGTFKPMLEMAPKEWDRSFDANVRSLFLAAKMAVPLMDGRQNPAIIAVTSFGSRSVLPGYGAIGASKAALESLVRYLAVELGPIGIAVNAVSPGVVATGALDFFADRAEMLERTERRTGRGPQSPDEIARVIAMLCSPEAAAIRGEIITCDGGYSIVDR